MQLLMECPDVASVAVLNWTRPHQNSKQEWQNVAAAILFQAIQAESWLFFNLRAKAQKKQVTLARIANIIKWRMITIECRAKALSPMERLNLMSFTAVAVAGNNKESI